MTTFTRHTVETAPEASRARLESTRQAWGFIPGLYATLAESPVALEATDRLAGLTGQTSLSPVELQVTFLAASVFHGCAYCTVGHTYLARQAKVPEPVVQALRESQAIEAPRLQALRLFTEAVLRDRGFAGDAAVEAFLAAGFTRAQVLEVVILLALKTISNYVNNLTHTPRDPFMADATLAWNAPRDRGQR